MTPAQTLTRAIRHPKHPDRPAVMPYLVAQWPDATTWGDLLLRVSDLADAIEVGVPFSDPVADGPVIQKATRAAIDGGASLTGLLDLIEALPRPPACPLVLMSYLNPLLQVPGGLPALVARCARLGFGGFIVPDMPWEEGEEMRALLAEHGLAAIQLVTPVTPDERLRALTAGDDGFVYAVTVTGITGAAIDREAVHAYLDRVRALARKPVCAGFGIRTRDDVRSFFGHADGAIVGTALVEALAAGVDGAAFVADLVA